MRPTVASRGWPSLLLLALLSQLYRLGVGAWSEDPWVWEDTPNTGNTDLRDDLGNPAYQCDTTAAWRADVIAMLRKDVSDDYEVFEGVLDFPAFSQPAGRYGLVNLPPEQAPPALCAIARNVPSPYGPQLCNRTFVLGPRDAVVGLLCTPPPVRYFGLRSYTIFRFRPSPWLSAAELADPINNLLINTTSGDPKDVFRRTAAIVSSSDGVVQSKLTAALERAGVPSGAINQDVVSADKAYFRDTSKVWLRDRSDALGWLFRVSSFINATEVEPYFKQKWPVLLLRAKEAKGLRPRTEPLATPPLRPRGTGLDESFLAPQLQALVSSITAHMASRFNATWHAVFNMSHIVPDVARCLSDPTYSPIEGDIPVWNITAIPTCGFFTRDALYTWMDQGTPYGDLYFPKNRVYFLVGVNQPLLGKSAYLNIFMTAVASPQKPGRTFNYSAPALQGTATPYAPDLPDVDKLFAIQLARHCDTDDGGRQCTVVTEKAINTTEYVYVVQRQYLEPSTQIGPSPEECLLPLVLSFTLPEVGMGRRDPAVGEEDRLAGAETE